MTASAPPDSSAPLSPPTSAAGTEALLAAVAFDDRGLVPVIAQDIGTGGVRMFAWADRQALRLTATTGAAHFWSRSRQAMWRKGETSGNVLHVRDIRVDCDGDVVLYLVDAHGPSCHTGRTSCFYRSFGGIPGEAPQIAESSARRPIEDDGPAPPLALVMQRVAEVIAHRRQMRPDKSYVVSLLDGGWPKVSGKITEEAGELVEALPLADASHTAHEAADLFFHVLVGLEKAGVPVDDVFRQLQQRFGVSGIDEKAQRGRSPQGASSDDQSVADAGAAPAAAVKARSDR